MNSCEAMSESIMAKQNGAGDWIRTSDLRFTKPLLYQLSYASVNSDRLTGKPANRLIKNGSSSPHCFRVRLRRNNILFDENSCEAMSESIMAKQNGAEAQTCTGDAGLFRPALY